MSMKLSILATYFDADEAFTIIAFLDQLREVLAGAYAEQIQLAQRVYRDHPTVQLDLDFGDPPF